MRKTLFAAVAFLLPFAAVALPPSPSVPVPSTSITANGVTQPLSTFMGYLAGIVNPNPVSLGSNLSVSGASTFNGAVSHGANSVTGSNFGITGGAINGTPIGATSASTGAFTTLSTTGNATIGGTASLGSTNPISISGGQIYANSTVNFVMAGTNPLVFQTGGGSHFVINGTASTVTGRLNLIPATGNNPITWTTNNSTNTDQSIATILGSPKSQSIVYTSNLSGAYANPATNSNNCGGLAGMFIICNSTDTQSGGGVSGITVQRYFGGAGTTGGRLASNFLLVLTSPTSDTSNSFYGAGKFYSEMRASVGGSLGARLGSNFALAAYSRLTSGATDFLENSGTEYGLSITTGASADKQHGVSVVLLAENANAPAIESTGFAVSAQTGAAATIQCAYCVGRYDGQNAISSNGTAFSILAPQYSGGGPSIMSAADFRLGTFSLGAMVSKGVTIGPGASIRVGRSFLTDTTTGLNISPVGSVGLSATVQSAGTGYNANTALNLTDAYGGIWQASVSAGGVSAVTLLSAPYTSGSAPANPIALISSGGQSGTGATINVTWGTGSTVSFAGGVQLAQSTVSNLPTCTSSLVGVIYEATDLTSPTYNATLTGGGAVKRPVTCNGTSWVS